MENVSILDEFFKDEEHDIEIALSYSRTADYSINGPRSLVTRSNVNSVSARIGSIVDDFINPNVDVSNKYYIFDGIKPTATLGKLIDIIVENYNELPVKEKVLEIIKNNKFWASVVKEEVLLSKFDSNEFWSYLTSYYEAKGKVIIPTDIYMIAQELSTIVKTHTFTKFIFEDNYDIIYQHEFKLKYKNVVFRGFLDFVLIDKVNKSVQIIDLKTGKEDANNFLVSFLKYRYYLQEAVYMKSFKDICNKFNLKGYSLLPFQFLYISKSQKIPMFYSVSKKWHEAGLKGFITENGYNYKGLEELVDEIKWHYQNNIFDMTKTLYESKGLIKLNDKFINVNE
jgi:hypothetical protein